METSPEGNKVPISLPPYKPTERELRRQAEAEERWRKVQRDPRTTGEMLDEIRRKFDKKPPPNTNTTQKP